MICYKCGQPAVGQCKNCGKFYCKDHGDVLCIVCAEAGVKVPQEKRESFLRSCLVSLGLATAPVWVPPVALVVLFLLAGLAIAIAKPFVNVVQEIQGTTSEDLELNRLTYTAVYMLDDPVLFQEEIKGLRDYSRDYQRLSGGIGNSNNWEVIPGGKERGFREVLEIYENLTQGVLINEGRAEILGNVPAERRSVRQKIQEILAQLNDYQIRSGLQHLDEPAFYGFLKEQGYTQYQIDVWQAMVEAYRTNDGEKLAQLLAEE